METEDKFKNSPIHDKRAVLELMDKLEPKEMVKVVDFIQEQVKLFCQPDVIKSVCEHTVDDLIFKNDNRAECKCGAEWHY